MIALTLRCDATLEHADRGVVDAAVRARAGTIVWRTNERPSRSYALVELPDDEKAVRAIVGERIAVRMGWIIALAVYPSVPEALPALEQALGGPGRPAGVLSCEAVEGGVALEWDPRVTAPSLVFGLIDVELARFACGRTCSLLSPLPPALAAEIAAQGLATPEIGAERVLELLMERAGLHA